MGILQVVTGQDWKQVYLNSRFMSPVLNLNGWSCSVGKRMLHQSFLSIVTVCRNILSE